MAPIYLPEAPEPLLPLLLCVLVSIADEETVAEEVPVVIEPSEPVLV